MYDAGVRDPIAREFLLAFWKIHILHHAADGRGVYGQWMLEELHHHGYRLSPGTLYPILARMAQRGWLRSTEPERSKSARVYHLTPRGHEVLGQLRRALDELYGEVGVEATPRRPRSTTATQPRTRQRVPRSTKTVAG
jgi:PadR family transcriptional regulator, regulatory protein PadR